MAKKESLHNSVKEKQLTRSVLDDNDQIVLEEGNLLGSTELLILKSRGIALDSLQVQKPLASSQRNALFDKLEGEILLDLDYPAKLNIPSQPGEEITPEVLKQLKKLKICPSFYMKRTFRGAPFDIIAPVADTDGAEIILPAKKPFTLGILQSLTQSGFNLFEFLPDHKTANNFLSTQNGKKIVAARSRLTKRFRDKLMLASIGGVLPAAGRELTARETVIAPDCNALLIRGEKITHSVLSRIYEYSLTMCQPDIYSYLEGRPAPFDIIKIAGQREELRPMHLLKLFELPGFDIALFYRNLGRREMSHWFDPFMDILLQGFNGGRITQKTGTIFDPNNPLRKYHGLVKIRIADTAPQGKTGRKHISDYRKIKMLTNPNLARSASVQKRTQQAGGRFVALMCIIRHKRKVPTIFYHTTLREDIPLVKTVLDTISKRLELEGGIHIQEGRLL